MQCLKCGREIDLGQVFCEDCLADMEKYPVKPGTPVRLPERRETAPVKMQYFRRPPAAPEVQVKRLRLQLWIVSSLLAVMMVLCGFAYWRAKHTLYQFDSNRLPGQNYSAAPGNASTGPAGK